MRRPLSVAVAVALAFAAPAAAQPGQASSYILLAGYADKGEACALLEPWEAAVIRAEARRYLTLFAPDERRSLLATAAASNERLTCDDEPMAEWLEASRAGIEREWLPPHLALFRALGSIDRMPLAFVATALPVEFQRAIVTIDEQFANWEAAGARPEGSSSWADYLARAGEAAISMTQALAGRGDDIAPDEAAAIVAEAGLVGRLWLLDQAANAGVE